MIQLQIGMDEVLALEAAGHEQAYQEFRDKFKPKKTTDDCYTPENIYDAVADWVAGEYGLDRGGSCGRSGQARATRTGNTRTAVWWWTIRRFLSWRRSSHGT